jgi:hypothetical protein
MYKHVCTLFRPVCTCLYKYISVSTQAYIAMYIWCTNLNMYIHVCYLFHVYIHVCQSMYSWCSEYRWLHTVYQMYRHCWTVYVHWCIPLGTVFLFGSGCCQVSHLFKFKHTSLISISLSGLPLSTQCPRLPDRAGGRCRPGSCRHLPATACASRACAGVAPGRCSQNTVQHCLYIDVPGLEMSVHEKVKMLQESYHPGLAIPRWSVSVWTLYAQNDQFL